MPVIAVATKNGEKLAIVVPSLCLACFIIRNLGPFELFSNIKSRLYCNNVDYAIAFLLATYFMFFRTSGDKEDVELLAPLG